MTDNDQHKKIRIDQLHRSLTEISQSEDRERITQNLGLMQLRCLDFIEWLNRFDAEKA